MPHSFLGDVQELACNFDFQYSIQSRQTFMITNHSWFQEKYFKSTYAFINLTHKAIHSQSTRQGSSLGSYPSLESTKFFFKFSDFYGIFDLSMYNARHVQILTYPRCSSCKGSCKPHPILRKTLSPMWYTSKESERRFSQCKMVCFGIWVHSSGLMVDDPINDGRELKVFVMASRPALGTASRPSSASAPPIIDEGFIIIIHMPRKASNATNVLAHIDKTHKAHKNRKI